jgi:hypothetical protein
MEIKIIQLFMKIFKTKKFNLISVCVILSINILLSHQRTKKKDNDIFLSIEKWWCDVQANKKKKLDEDYGRLFNY